MNKVKFLKFTFLLAITFGFISCNQEAKSSGQTEKASGNDTITVKHKHDLNKAYEVGFLSKSYSYYWIDGKDTLDLVLRATEYQKDSTLHLVIHHKKPILFTTALAKINDCSALIKEDFYLSKLHSLYFEAPVFYFDLTKELSAEYEKQFGRKNVSYEKLNQFLLNSKLNKQLDDFANPLDKKTKRYGIEKFHLMEKKHFDTYLPNADLTDYPEFALHGMGLYVQLENKE